MRVNWATQSRAGGAPGDAGVQGHDAYTVGPKVDTSSESPWKYALSLFLSKLVVLT
jgi:hypothetical protein